MSDPTGDEADVDPDVQFPRSIRIAGITWFAYGMLGLLETTFVMLEGPLGGDGIANCGPSCLCGTIHVLFLLIGIETVRSQLRGKILANGVLSIAFGCFYVAIAVLAVRHAVVANQLLRDVVIGGFSATVGVGLVAAGVLAMVGWRRYIQWRIAAGLERRPVRSQEAEDYDDLSDPRVEPEDE